MARKDASGFTQKGSKPGVSVEAKETKPGVWYAKVSGFMIGGPQKTEEAALAYGRKHSYGTDSMDDCNASMLDAAVAKLDAAAARLDGYEREDAARRVDAFRRDAARADAKEMTKTSFDYQARSGAFEVIHEPSASTGLAEVQRNGKREMIRVLKAGQALGGYTEKSINSLLTKRGDADGDMGGKGGHPVVLRDSRADADPDREISRIMNEQGCSRAAARQVYESAQKTLKAHNKQFGRKDADEPAKKPAAKDPAETNPEGDTETVAQLSEHLAGLEEQLRAQKTEAAEQETKDIQTAIKEVKRRIAYHQEGGVSDGAYPTQAANGMAPANNVPLGAPKTPYHLLPAANGMAPAKNVPLRR